MNNLKGQFTIIGLLMTFVAIVVFVMIAPVMNSFIADYIANSTDAATNSLLQMMPFFLVIAILMGAVFYIIPHREQTGQI